MGYIEEVMENLESAAAWMDRMSGLGTAAVIVQHGRTGTTDEEALGIRQDIICSPEAEAYWRNKIASELEPQWFRMNADGIVTCEKWEGDAQGDHIAAFVRNNKTT